jgi:hypothetical protein
MLLNEELKTMQKETIMDGSRVFLNRLRNYEKLQEHVGLFRFHIILSVDLLI